MYVRFCAAEHAEVCDRFEAGESVRSLLKVNRPLRAAVHNLIVKTDGIRTAGPDRVV